MHKNIYHFLPLSINAIVYLIRYSYDYTPGFKTICPGLIVSPISLLSYHAGILTPSRLHHIKWDFPIHDIFCGVSFFF